MTRHILQILLVLILMPSLFSQQPAHPRTQLQPQDAEQREMRNDQHIKQQVEHQVQLNEQQGQLSQWISQQLRIFSEEMQSIIVESFSFFIEEGEPVQFKWDPSKNKELKISIMVFSAQNGGDFVLARDIQQDQFMEVDWRDEGSRMYNPLGTVYVSKVMRVNFNTDYKYIRFTSKNSQKLFINIDVQKLETVVTIQDKIKDDHLAVSSTKLSSILQQIISEQKTRQHTYKYEWGFLENHYKHDSTLLGLTGFELLGILGTAITQIYFVRKLLDNRTIV